MMRLITSSKFQAAFVATALAIGGWCFAATDKNLDRAHKLEATQTAIKFICLTWFAAIGATGLEDAAGKHGSSDQKPAQPTVQVNTDPGSVSNPPPSGMSTQQFAELVAQLSSKVPPVRVDTPPIKLPSLTKGP